MVDLVLMTLVVISKEKLKRQHERRSIEKEIETMRVAVEQYENGHPHIVRLLCTKASAIDCQKRKLTDAGISTQYFHRSGTRISR